MSKAARPCIIAGNWKMYKTIEQGLEFIDFIAPVAKKSSAKVFLAVPFTAIKPLAERVKETDIVIGAQNMNDASEGAFTGEVSGSMLKDAGAQFVLLGHSERRSLFAESDEFINRKVKSALECGLQPILCLGETFEDHHNDLAEPILKKQIEECLLGIGKEAHKALILAYEPRWAIGTGLPATPELASKTQLYCREILTGLWGEKEAQKVPILYGGSVTVDNAAGFLEAANIDGLLIGTASLKAETFAKIIALRQN